MSVHVMSWVLRNSEATLGKRLVLLALADHAREDGTGAWPSIQTLIRDTRLSERQVQYALRGLETDGEIRRAGRTAKGTNVYDVVMGGAISAPRGGAIERTEGVQSTTKGVQPTAPDPSLEQPSKEEPSRPSTVDRKQVTADEWSLAQAILEIWNVLAHQQLRSHDWLRKIILRIREYPELTISEHEHIIRYALDHPWWKGDPAPAVVYGNGALFEQHLMQAAKGRGVGAQGAFAVALAALKGRRQA